MTLRVDYESLVRYGDKLPGSALMCKGCGQALGFRVPHSGGVRVRNIKVILFLITAGLKRNGRRLYLYPLWVGYS